MINGMNIFYSSKTGSGLKVVSKGLEPIQKNAIKSELMGVV